MSAALPAPFGSDLKVLVLAGSNPVSARRKRLREKRRARGEQEVQLENKAFLSLRGRLVVEYVLDCLQACGLRHVWVLGSEDSLRRIPDRYRFTPIPQRPGATFFVNLSAAHAEIRPGPDEPVLVMFGDHPLNTPGALTAFLTRCAEHIDSVDFFHGFALTEAYERYSAWFRRNSVNLREMSGRATGMNLAVPSRLHRLRAFDELYAVRKQERLGSFVELLRRLVGWLGWRSLLASADCLVLWLAKEAEKRARGEGGGSLLARTLLRSLRRLVPASRIEAYAARILQAERGVRLIPLAHGGSAIDVDFAEELQMLEDHWQSISAVAESEEHDGQQHS